MLNHDELDRFSREVLLKFANTRPSGAAKSDSPDILVPLKSKVAISTVLIRRDCHRICNVSNPCKIDSPAKLNQLT